MKIIIPYDKSFEYYKCKKLYEKYKKVIGDDATFSEIIKNTLFYSFYDYKILVGCIYLYEKETKLFINGFAKRGFHKFNISALKSLLNLFNCDIYAKSIQKSAIYLLLKCGFKKIAPNLFVYYKNN